MWAFIRSSWEHIKETWQSGQTLGPATVSLAMVSFLTTAAGIISTSPDHFLALSARGLVLTVVAFFFAAGVACGIAGMATMLYHRFSLMTLIGLFTLSSCAVLFDTAFFQSQYAAYLEHTVGRSGAVDLTTRRSEYDRLTNEFAGAIAQAQAQLQATLDVLKQKRADAQAIIKWETEERLPIDTRYCGPVCKKHQRLVARYAVDIERLEDMQRRLADAPPAPTSNSWEALKSFHATSVGILRLSNQGTSLPAAPVEPELITSGGMLVADGGLGGVVEMIQHRHFDQPKLMLPLILSMMCEYLIIIFVLTARPWRPFRAWLVDTMIEIETFATRFPALCPFVKRIVAQLIWWDSPDAVAIRQTDLQLAVLKTQQLSVETAKASAGLR